MSLPMQGKLKSQKLSHFCLKHLPPLVALSACLYLYLIFFHSSTQLGEQGLLTELSVANEVMGSTKELHVGLMV